MSSEERSAASSDLSVLQEGFAARAASIGAELLTATASTLVPVLREHLGPLAASGVGVAHDVLLLVPGIEALIRPGSPWPAVAVTRGAFGVAATGTVVLADPDDANRRLGLLCRRHIVLLPPLILPDLNAAVPFLQSWATSRERPYVSFVTGPSRTSDIERVLTIGVHGPAELVIVLVQDWGGNDA